MSTTATETQTPTGTWNLDPVHSAVGFEVPYLAGTFKGQFRETTGRLNVIHGIAVDSDGSVYAAEVRSRRVQRFRRLDGGTAASAGRA